MSDVLKSDFAVQRPIAPLMGWLRGHAPGICVAATIALASSFIASTQGGPVMLYALLFGMAFNFLATDVKCVSGLSFCSKKLLRVGIALLGVRIAVSDITDLGFATAALVVAAVSGTLAIGWLVGRLMGLKSPHAILSAGAVAICGASAALAIASVLPQTRENERNTLLTIVGVTGFSTLAMLTYPMLTSLLGFDDHAAGIFIGASIHDVAQVVGAGYIVSDSAGETATIVKLMRVACLAPAVMVITLLFRDKTEHQEASQPPVLPVFLICFFLLAGLNSADILPSWSTSLASDLSRWFLIIAVGALGVKISIKEILAPGATPLIALALQTTVIALIALSGVMLMSSS